MQTSQLPIKILNSGNTVCCVFSIIYGSRDFNATCLVAVLYELSENLNKMAELQSSLASEVSLGGRIVKFILSFR